MGAKSGGGMGMQTSFLPLSRLVDLGGMSEPGRMFMSSIITGMFCAVQGAGFATVRRVMRRGDGTMMGMVWFGWTGVVVIGTVGPGVGMVDLAVGRRVDAM